MQRALYCPDSGYYERTTDPVGRGGDFHTNVSVGALFGRLLAFQFGAWLEAIPAPAVHLVEAGAHDGRLARDVLEGLQRCRPGLWERTEYRILEPSPARQARQRTTLAGMSDRVRWFTHWEEMADWPVRGVIFSNELLDAFPVHRLGWDALNRRWFEWGVTEERGRFVWTRLPAPEQVRAALPQPRMLSGLADVLPDGFTTEVCPEAAEWWRRAAETLREGRLVTFDYGLEAEDFFSPQRAGGTLRAYRGHRQSADLLADPGEQDLTAHVNFSAVRAAGEQAGLWTERCEPQSSFLTRVAEKTWQAGARFDEWTPAGRRQFQTLVHPEHLGRAFQVLVQARGRRGSSALPQTGCEQRATAGATAPGPTRRPDPPRPTGWERLMLGIVHD